MTTISAIDVAGAIVWTPLALLNLYALVSALVDKKTKPDTLITGFIFQIILSFLAAYCVAKICGAQ